MWPRKRLDISWLDLAAGCWAVLTAWNRVRFSARLAKACPEPHLVTLSVRSALHLVLKSVDWPPGSEVLMSAMNIPDMARIVRHHGFTPVPIDLELNTAAPSVAMLERAVTPATRGLVLAHLFGSRIVMEDMLTFATAHNLDVIEDCAQAYAGPRWNGTPGCLASLFSFGPIKTTTAAGGGILVVRDARFLAQVTDLQRTWPQGSRWGYALKLARLVVLKALGYRRSFAAFRLACKLLRIDYDHALNHSVRAFPGKGLLEQIERQPATPLLALLARMIENFATARLQRRRQGGDRLAAALPAPTIHLGGAGQQHTHWVFPILATNPQALISGLRKQGFDATQGVSMHVISPPEGHCDTAVTIRDHFRHLVYLPLYPDMPDAEVDRLARVVSDLEASHG